MFPQNHTKNAYLVARIKSLASEFLDQNDIERMVEAKDGEEALHVLNETVYAKYLGDAKSPRGFDIVLNESLGEVKQMIWKIFSPKQWLHFLWLKYDFLNVKSLLKARFANLEPKLNHLGEISFNDLRAVIMEGETKKLPYDLNATITEVVEHYEKNHNPQEIDFVLDKKYLEVFGREIVKIQSKYLTNFLRREIDLFNIKTYFRFSDSKLCEEALMPGGLIPIKKFQSEDAEKLIESIEDIEERSLLQHLKAQLDKEGIIVLEREGRKILLGLLSEMEGKILGIEPVFAFWQAKLEETKLIHRIMTLKNAGVAPAEIHRLVGASI